MLITTQAYFFLLLLLLFHVRKKMKSFGHCLVLSNLREKIDSAYAYRLIPSRLDPSVYSSVSEDWFLQVLAFSSDEEIENCAVTGDEWGKQEGRFLVSGVFFKEQQFHWMKRATLT